MSAFTLGDMAFLSGTQSAGLIYSPRTTEAGNQRTTEASNIRVTEASVGGDETWTPAEITTALWLDAADSATLFDATTGGSLPADDGAIARWEDKSGNARHATQGTAASRGIRKASELNGNDVIRFDGGNDFFSHPVLVSDPTALTIAFVFKDISASTGIIWSHRSEATRLIQLTSQSSTEIRLQLRSSSSSLITLSAAKSANSWTMVVAVFNKAGNNHRLWVNGIGGTANTTAFSSQTFTATQNHIADVNAGAAPPQIPFGGDIAEGVITTTALSDSDIDKLFGYFAHTHGLTANLPIDHPYKTVAP